MEAGVGQLRQGACAMPMTNPRGLGSDFDPLEQQKAREHEHDLEVADTRAEARGQATRSGPGLGFVVFGTLLGGVASVVAGLLVAAFLNSWLAIDWVRGIATLAAGVVVAGSLLRSVIHVARARLRYLKENAGIDR